jgi:Flp pilus assembly CpaE family ATPase
MRQPTRVVLALDAPDIGDEVIHALDRSGDAQVVATATDGRQLAEAARQLEPDLVLAEPRLAGAAPAGVPCITIASRESVAALRAAVEAHAIGFYVWPLERDALIDRVARSSATAPALERRATVVAVHASRGGAGCTFVSTHLAAAVSSDGHSCLLIDADPDGDDVATALDLGSATDEAPRTLAQLATVADELTPDALRRAAPSHEVGGFGVVPAPDDDTVMIDTGEVRRLVAVAAASYDVVILHLARGLDAATRLCLDDADVVLEVLTLDVGSFRGATRTMARLGVATDDPRWRLVVNRAGRSEVVPADVQRVFGRPAVAVIPHDPAIQRAQDHRRILSGKGRAARAMTRLARAIVDERTVEGAA